MPTNQDGVNTDVWKETKETCPRSARFLLSKYNLGGTQQLTRTITHDDKVKDLATVTFCDDRWGNAIKHMAESGEWSNEESVKTLIQNGARAFGFWHLPDAVLQSLTGHILAEEPRASPGMDFLVERSNSDQGPWSTKATNAGKRRAANSVHAARQDPKTDKVDRSGKTAKIVLLLFVFVLSNLYAVDVVCIMYPGIFEDFGVPVYFARAGGAGVLLWTAVLFLSMAKSFHKILARIVTHDSFVMRVLEQHKELHIFSGQMMVLTIVIHVVSHCVGTIPGLISVPLDKLNVMLGCADPAKHEGYMNVRFWWLDMSACPMVDSPSYLGVLFKTTPGLSGVALVLLMALIAYTANESRRKANFEIFMYVHNAAMPLWLILLFVHGSNGWIGVGFPLVVFVCSVPVLLYVVDRLLRIVRYYRFAGKAAKLVDVVIRPGAHGGAKGALINLKFSKPLVIWDARDGMYGMICMPEYSKYQWHPFTISSSCQDDTVDFIVMSVGDWTQNLAERCLAARSDDVALPTLRLDGPYLAPTVTALSQEVLIAVGAGVGFTPFLSLLSGLIASLSDESARDTVRVKEAHFFWLTRSADEFLFARKHFTRILSNPCLRDRIFLHLHVTQKEQEGDVAAFMFREAVRRQSKIDKVVFDEILKDHDHARDLVGKAQLPWHWVHGATGDTLWVESLVEDPVEDAQVADAHNHHWSQGILRRDKTGGLFRQSSVSLDKSLGEHRYLPVVFGRPNFSREILAIGNAWPEYKAHVYVCGNDLLVQSLRDVCEECNAYVREAGGQEQDKFRLHFERFG